MRQCGPLRVTTPKGRKWLEWIWPVARDSSDRLTPASLLMQTDSPESGQTLLILRGGVNGKVGARPMLGLTALGGRGILQPERDTGSLG